MLVEAEPFISIGVKSSMRNRNANQNLVFIILCDTARPIKNPLQITDEYLSKYVVLFETIYSRLKIKHVSREAHTLNIYEKIGADRQSVKIVRKDHKPPVILAAYVEDHPKQIVHFIHSLLKPGKESQWSFRQKGLFLIQSTFIIYIMIFLFIFQNCLPAILQ